MMLTSLDSDHVRATVTAVDDAGQPVDLSTASVKFAFMQGSAKPAPTDFTVGEWSPQNPKIARIYVGPHGLVLPPGRYAVWLDINAGTSEPVRSYDTLTVT